MNSHLRHREIEQRADSLQKTGSERVSDTCSVQRLTEIDRQRQSRRSWN